MVVNTGSYKKAGMSNLNISSNIVRQTYNSKNNSLPPQLNLRQALRAFESGKKDLFNPPMLGEIS